jgi:ADP-heptose:LPS heptosyltransferase
MDEQDAEALLGETARVERRRVVGLHPGGSARWKTKRWHVSRWIGLCEALQAHRCHLVVVGGPEERPIGEALARALREPVGVVIGETSVMTLACVIRRCGAFVAHDSSSLHVAAAVGTPTVALFGPTDPRRHLPPGFLGRVVRRPVWCSPCYSPWCRTITHACMERISVEDVLNAVLDLLSFDPQSTIHDPRTVG